MGYNLKHRAFTCSEQRTLSVVRQRGLPVGSVALYSLVSSGEGWGGHMVVMMCCEGPMADSLPQRSGVEWFNLL